MSDAGACASHDGRTATCTWTDPAPPVPDYGMGLPPPYPELPRPVPERHQQVFAAGNGFVVAGGVRAVALGASHGRSCAVTPEHEVSCWGQWYFGGDWAYHRPHVIAGTQGAIAVAVAEDHACALLADHSVRCWGYDRSGELGNGVATETMVLSAAATAITFP